METATQPTEVDVHYDKLCAVCRYPIDNQGLCVMDAEHAGVWVPPAPQETPAQHSPLPWKIVDRRRAPLPNIVIMSGEEIVADIEGVHMRDRMLRWKPEDADAADAHARANADLIIKCVNRDPAFQKLVRSLQQIRLLLEGIPANADSLRFAETCLLILTTTDEALRLARQDKGETK